MVIDISDLVEQVSAHRKSILDAELAIQKLQESFKLYCKDTSICLEDRWKLFIENDLGDHYDSILRMEELTYNWHDHFYSDGYKRYKTINFVEDIYEIDYSITAYPLLYTYTKENLDEIKEFLLQNWTRSCVFDW
jgi:hypothetical protein